MNTRELNTTARSKRDVQREKRLGSHDIRDRIASLPISASNRVMTVYISPFMNSCLWMATRIGIGHAMGHHRSLLDAVLNHTFFYKILESMEVLVLLILPAPIKG
jgi:hypothetical protein